jgi:tetratricopeptide (TPR) repeat protein
MNARIVLICIFCIINIEIAWNQSNIAPQKLLPDSAVNYFKKMLTRNKNSPFALYGLASAYYAKNDFNNALSYSKLNLKNKNDFDTACNLIYACSLDRSGRIKEAIDEFETAIKKYPDSYLLWYQYALSCYKYRNHKKVQEALTRSISINPYFPEQHYLLGCSMFENNNDAGCIYPFLYGLMLDNDSVRASNAIVFIITYLDKKPEQINIPFFEDRYAVNSIDDILSDYFPVKSKWRAMSSVQPIELSKKIEDYLKNNYPQQTGFYSVFNNKIFEEKQTEPYIYYCLRTTSNEYVSLWLKNNAELLKAFSDFLDKNLIVK